MTRRKCCRFTGIGIAEDAMAGLFEAFTQAVGSITRKYGGTGLGLTISRKIVEMMQGRIWVERNDNPGSTFYFTLSLGCRPQGKRRPPLRLPGAVAAKTVLVVDDNSLFRHLLERQISGFGMQVESCASGEQALGLLKHPASRKTFDLILMDAIMPGWCGIDAAGRIRSELDRMVPPIIIMESPFASGMCKAEGCDGLNFLSKPLLPEPLYETLLAVFTQEGEKTGPDADQSHMAHEILRRLAGVRILLVEDNSINRMILLELIEGANIHMDVCEDGRQAISAVGRKHYDAVLMDIQMPGMDGYETTRLIREQKPLEELPIIAISAHAFEEHQHACLEAGMNDFIAKPIDINDLLTKLAANISGRTDPDYIKPQRYCGQRFEYMKTMKV